MCGIAGRVNVTERVSVRQVTAMSDLIAHRGPDGDGLHVDGDGRAALAHRRLAIVDKKGGAQPVYGEGRRVVLVYNGEVYNHRALREQLEACGHRFASRCDTEAILHAHEELGLEAPGRLRGMFAYAAWEPQRRRLTLVRDRLGIKPIYYALLPSGDLLFASDLKALLVEQAVDRAIDDDALSAYLSLRYVPAPATMIRGVRKLEAGCALVWEQGRVAIHRWWGVPAGDSSLPPAPPTEAEAGGRLTDLLDEVVELRRMAEVPLGTFLSGGLDSTVVTAILAERCRAEGLSAPHTFAVGYEGAAADSELDYARRAAKALGTRHHELLVSGAEVAAELGRIAWHLDEPVGDPAAASLWFIARRAREDVTVILSGEGADEVFAGYALYAHAARARRLRQLPGATAAARLLSALPGRLGRAAELVAEHHLYRGISRAFTDDEKPAWGSPDGLAGLLAPARARALGAATELGRMLAFDQQVWLPDDLLVKADKTTMAHALELRVPLLDHRLLEEVSTWPDAWKLDGGTGKKILRRAAAGLVPDFVLRRPKMGFATPSAAWLRRDLRDLSRDLLTSSTSLARERGDLPLVHRLLAEHGGHTRDRSPELWALLQLELWRTNVLTAVEVILPDEADADASISMAG